MDSPEAPDQQPKLVTPDEARSVRPAVPEPDELARKELEFGHARETQKAEQGWIGKAFGSRSEKPGNIAAVVIFFSFIMMFWAYAGTAGKDPIPESFFKLVTTFLGVIGLALGYLFGSSNRGG